MKIGDKAQVLRLLDELQNIDNEAGRIACSSVDVTLGGRYIGSYLNPDGLEAVKDIVLRWLARSMIKIVGELDGLGMPITTEDGVAVRTEEDAYKSLRSRFFS